MLSDAAANHGTVKFPWFQSTTTDKVHSYTFIHTKWQPRYCTPRCESRGYAFPVHFHIQSCSGKNMTPWNPKESEYILLPNLPLRVRNVTKLPVDPMSEMTWEEVEAWLRSAHELPDWFQEFRFGKGAVGPWFQVADFVKAKRMNGAAFIRWYFNNLQNNWERQLNMTWEEDHALSEGMKGRYALAAFDGFYGFEPNQARWFYLAELEDARPCV